MFQPASLTIDLRQMILAIETAVSLVGMNDTNHGKRVGYIASQICSGLGQSDDEIQAIFELGMLHDCGVSTEQMHSNLVNHFDWSDAHIHCEIGYRLLKDFVPLEKYALPILYHHTPWEKLKTLDLPDEIKRKANLIFLSDRVDVLAATHYDSDILIVRDEILASINSYRETYFDPFLVDAFAQVEASEAFWITLSDRHITRYTWDMGQFSSSEPLSLKQIKQLSLIMSYIVDQKSAFTAQHSARVADLAKFLAYSYGLTDYLCDKVEIAGLLHDLGKLHTPDHILEKPGPLNAEELAIMNQHSYETFEILRHISGLGDVAEWAAFHHEGVNGLGYPFHLKDSELSIEARIIAVADIFQALVQDRPYRKGMTEQEVLEILDGMAQSGKLDVEVVGIAERHSAECFNIAKGTSETGNRNSIDLFAPLPETVPAWC